MFPSGPAAIAPGKSPNPVTSRSSVSVARFTTESELSLETHAVRERVDRRMSVLGEKLWGNGEVLWIGNGRLDDVLYRRDEAAPEVSVVYGSIDA